ncbi:MAG: DUF6519 domain-containing protein [Burkholderiales bacterium]
MKGDFSRLTFGSERRYSSVRLQQGRVLVDADWNEEHDILAHRIATETVDVIGKCGAPLHAPGLHVVASFAELTPEEQALPGNANPPAGPLLVSAGRYYVDGLLIENARIVSILDQPDLPPPGTAPIVKLASGGDAPFPPPRGTYIVYVDTWQRHVTALEDDSLREKALGGPDHATRTRTVWQVKLLEAPAGTTCTTVSPAWTALIAPPTGKLVARAVEPPPTDNPCSISPGGGYRRLENQLYRVEVHDSGSLDTATFKWSRENGSVVTRWLGNGANANELKVASIGPDEVLRFAPQQWVELTDDEHELQGKPGVLVQLANAENDILTILPATAIPAGPIVFAAFKTNPKVRRWESDAAGDALRVIEIAGGNTGFLPLEDGVEIKFSAGTYRSGDYWLIPARTATADIEWPAGKALPPHGVEHHYCRLAVAEVGAATGGAATIKLTDCRPIFPPLTELPDAGGDLKKHNKYLHGWGVVCGLQVHCGGENRTLVRIEKGYAIACDGTDIWVPAAQTLPILEAAAKAQLIDANGNGTACITLTPAANNGFTLGVIADPEANSGFWERVLDGTLLQDVLEDCVKPLRDVLSKLMAADAAGAKLPVSDAARNQIAAVNLLAQLANESRGSRVLLSADEHERLAKLYQALIAELSSKTFCGIRDDLLPLPTYPFGASGLSTGYGRAAHRRLRVDAASGRAYAFGDASTVVHAYGLKDGELEREVTLSGQNLEVLDVLPVGKSVLAVAADDHQSLIYTLDPKTLEQQGEPVAVPGARVARLLWFGTDLERGGFALVQGVGLVEFSPAKPGAIEPGRPVVAFNATGHLSSLGSVTGRLGQLFAGAAAAGASTDRYSQVVEIRIGAGGATSGATIPLIAPNGQAASGADAIEFIAARNAAGGQAAVQVVVDAGEHKTLLIWSGVDGPAKRAIPLGAVGGVSLAAVPELGVTAMTFEDEYYMTWVGPDVEKLDEADRVPLQLGPAAVQIMRTASSGPRLAVVLNRVSHTVTLLPIEYLAGQRRFDMAALAAYRGQMLAAFRDVLLRLVQRLKDCICDHLLVNCPTCDKDDVVVLACVEIRAKQVYSICNFHRREVVTFPKLFYWLSAVPIIPLVTEAIGELCCLVLPDRLRTGTKPASDFTSAKSVNALMTQARAFDAATLQKSVTGYLKMLGNAGIKATTTRLSTLKATPAKLRVDNVLNRNASTVRRSLASAGVAVNTVRPVSAAVGIPALASLPLTLAPGDRVDLFTENGKVVFYTRVSTAPADPQALRVEETAVMRSDLDALQRAIAERDLAAEQRLAEHAREIAALKAELARLRGAGAQGGSRAKNPTQRTKRPPSKE